VIRDRVRAYPEHAMIDDNKSAHERLDEADDLGDTTESAFQAKPALPPQ